MAVPAGLASHTAPTPLSAAVVEPVYVPAKADYLRQHGVDSSALQSDWTAINVLDLIPATGISQPDRGLFSTLSRTVGLSEPESVEIATQKRPYLSEYSALINTMQAYGNTVQYHTNPLIILQQLIAAGATRDELAGLVEAARAVTVERSDSTGAVGATKTVAAVDVDTAMTMTERLKVARVVDMHLAANSALQEKLQKAISAAQGITDPRSGDTFGHIRENGELQSLDDATKALVFNPSHVNAHEALYVYYLLTQGKIEKEAEAKALADTALAHLLYEQKTTQDHPLIKRLAQMVTAAVSSTFPKTRDDAINRATDVTAAPGTREYPAQLVPRQNTIRDNLVASLPLEGVAMTTEAAQQFADGLAELTAVAKGQVLADQKEKTKAAEAEALRASQAAKSAPDADGGGSLYLGAGSKPGEMSPEGAQQIQDLIETLPLALRSEFSSITVSKLEDKSYLDMQPKGNGDKERFHMVERNGARMIIVSAQNRKSPKAMEVAVALAAQANNGVVKICGYEGRPDEKAIRADIKKLLDTVILMRAPGTTKAVYPNLAVECDANAGDQVANVVAALRSSNPEYDKLFAAPRVSFTAGAGGGASRARTASVFGRGPTAAGTAPVAAPHA